MLRCNISHIRYVLVGKVIVLLALFALLGQATVVLADDCDNWGRLVHVGEQPGDDFCLAYAGQGGAVTKRLEDKLDFDYFIFYLGYDSETSISGTYEVSLTNTRLSRPKIVVGTFYDDASAWGGQTGTEVWYNAYSSSLGGMSLDEFQMKVTLGPNLKHDGEYELMNGEVVVINDGSDGAIRQEFHAVPVGTAVAISSVGDDTVRFDPPDKGAYIVMFSNYNPTRRNGTLTGSYTLNIAQD